MAMDKDRLGDAFADSVLTFLTEAPIAADNVKLRELMKALANDVITEIIGFAVVETITSTPNAEAGSSTLAGTGTGDITA